ncbi:MAG: CoA pyrophosphatase [Proteobacteria bacterium]|nr:CoA pyrophosphatase [Pseudomonadota bacterium]
MSPEHIIDRLQSASSGADGRIRSSRGVRRRGDSDLDGHPPQAGRRLAAVLVPLVMHESGMTVILTQRSAHLTEHAAEVSFPGGRMEAEDDGPVGAALRETEEEIGLPRSQIEVVGRLDDYETGTGYVVTPIVGLIRPQKPVTPDPFEVAEIFEVPLAFILDQSNHELRSGVFRGKERRYYAMPYEGHFIWGATAGMLVNLFEVLRKG